MTMTNKANMLVIIPARGGSKGIPNKNIVDLVGKPLIAWTVEASIAAKSVSRVIVSSDSQMILDIAVQAGAEALRRPDWLATDHSPTLPMISHVLEMIKLDDDIKYLALAQPTSPLRTAEHIQEAYDKLSVNDADSIISVQSIDSGCLKSFVLENNKLVGIRNNEYPFSRRQDLPPVYKANGALYIIEIEAFKKCKSLITDKTIPFVMDSVTSLDIDSLEDLELVKAELEKNRDVKK